MTLYSLVGLRSHSEISGSTALNQPQPTIFNTSPDNIYYSVGSEQTQAFFLPPYFPGNPAYDAGYASGGGLGYINSFIVLCTNAWAGGNIEVDIYATPAISYPTVEEPAHEFPVRDVVAMVPSSVSSLSSFTWVDQDGASLSTPSPSLRGGGSWALPSRPLSGQSWTEIARRTATPGTDPRDGTTKPGAGTWSIPIDSSMLRGGHLVIAFGLDAFFAQDIGTLEAYDLTGYHGTEGWHVYESLSPSTLTIPPLRARQRSRLTASHAGQATAEPLTFRARGDY